jgi:hypothetical protein
LTRNYGTSAPRSEIEKILLPGVGISVPSGQRASLSI